MCVCVCVCVRERERDRQTDRQTVRACLYLSAYVSVSMRMCVSLCEREEKWYEIDYDVSKHFSPCRQGLEIFLLYSLLNSKAPHLTNKRSDLGLTLKCIRLWDFNYGECRLPLHWQSTLTRRGITCLSFIYESYRFICEAIIAY